MRDADLGLCAACRARLSSPPPPVGRIRGLGGAVVAAPYAGPALGVVAALKSGRVPAAAATAAELICENAAPSAGRAAPLIPVPSGSVRRIGRGLDPAESIAFQLSRRLGSPLSAGRLWRLDGRAQRGRDRRTRLFDPPRFEAGFRAPPAVILVDDVITTGATLRSCALALRRAGASEVSAIGFALTPAPADAPSRFQEGSNPT